MDAHDLGVTEMLAPTAAGDDALALALADAAGEVLLAARDELTAAGADGTQLRREGDRRAQGVLAVMLATHRAQDAVLSEEAADDVRRLRADRVWIIDPLDGTREYAEGRSDWAVHVALWQGGELATGAVVLPAAGNRYGTAAPVAVPPAHRAALRLAVSRTRPPALVHCVAEILGAELVPMGSAGVKATAVLRGEADVYLHAGGQYEWDSAAPVAVARAAGLHTSRIDGSGLQYNRPDPYLPDLLVCRPQHAHTVLAAVAAARTDRGATA